VVKTSFCIFVGHDTRIWGYYELLTFQNPAKNIG